MPTLSFISLPRAPKAPRWISKVPGRTPFPAGRVDPASISSPHPYASPDIIDIHDRTTSESADEETVSEKPSVQAPPHVRIDLELSSEPFDSDWFQARFTATPSPSHQSLGGQKVEGSKIAASEGGIYGSSGRWEPPRSVPIEVQNDDYDDDIDLSTSEDDVLDHLKAMDASTFLNLPSPQPKPPSQSNETVEHPMPRRNAPTPIRIPSLSMHGAQVQIVRSAEANNPRPLSEVSSTESSAVSGQTLARALLGNSFVLSTDNRSSRYRSGFGGLVRSDSATLPRGDHPLMGSPHWRDRTLSGTSDTFAADINAPPVPSNAERVYVPPRTPRHSGIETKRKANFKRRSSTGSLVSPTSKSETHSRPNSVTEFAAEIERDILALHRISRISEAPSSTSTSPAHPDMSLKSPSPEHSPTEPSPISPDPLSPPDTHTPPPATSSSNRVSPSPSSTTLISPAKELESVLDYYSSSEKPEKPFSPAFSPIVEESSSQLSSPASKRLSASATPKSRTMSPLSGTTHGRMDLSTVRRPSDGAIIGRVPSSRRRFSQMSSPDPNNALPTPPQTSQSINSSYSSIASQRASSTPPRPPGAVVGGRLRSGSAPSPIKITRDSRDLNSYKIISPLPENALETPSTGGSSDGMATQQTFPETPSAFSPFWSPGSSNSPGMMQRLPEGYDLSPMPHTPMSAALPLRGGTIHPSPSHQVILTRASSMVHNSRRGGRTRPSAGTRGPAVLSTPEVGEDEATNNEARESVQEVEIPAEKPTQLSPDSSISQYSERSDEPSSRYERAGATTIEFTSLADQVSPSTIGSSPLLGYLGHNPSSPSTYSSPSVNASSPNNPSQYRQFGSMPDFTDPFDSQSRVGSSPRSVPRPRAISPGGRSLQTPPPVVITPPAAESAPVPAPYAGHFLRPISEISQNLESPPPYDTLDYDRPPPISIAGSSGSSVEGHSTNQFPQHAQQYSGSEYSSVSRKNSISNQNRRGRMRPTGPRRPLSNINNSSIARSRIPSEPSVVSTGSTSSTSTPRNPISTSNIEPKSLMIYPQPPDPQSDNDPSPSGTTIAVSTAAVPSPKSPSFNVPATPYRGLTMDQAKWTFTSSQLQTVVSRAIRQSAEASSIRLLRLETLDNEIPQELERLENRKTEIKAKYRSLTRSSEALYSKLNSHIGAGSSSAQDTLEELRDTTRQLNKLTEELHSVDQQHAQIKNLVEIHSASALSMALRKLNASFLKQLAQTQELQREVSDLRDELSIIELRSMKLAQENQLLQSQSVLQSSTSGPEVGSDSNTTNSPIGDNPTLGRKKSAQAAVTRKPSLVQFPRSAARWSGNRVSQRSSLSSNGNRSSVVFGGGASGTTTTFGVPPVPPLPRRRPTDIVTDGPPTRSATMLSTETPNTEVRAMMRAQDELYRMLGISLADRRVRRSHSIIGLPGNPEMQPHPSTTSTHFLQSTPAASGVLRADSLDSVSPVNRVSKVDGRPQSYPASLLEAYNPLDVDRNAMLATLDLLSQDEH